MPSTLPKTALILIDVYNDFLHPDGKLTSALAASLAESQTLEHLQLALQGARSANIPVYYSLHQQYHDGKYTGFEHWNAMLESIQARHAFELGSWGSEIMESLKPNPERSSEVVISKHWNQSSFRNTDLEWLLRQRDITHLVFAGLVVNSCIETTARDANELGYDVTMLSDATAGWTVESKNAAVEFSWPAFAHRIHSTVDWVRTIQGRGFRED